MQSPHILFEDQDLAVISKPTGVVVNMSDTVTEPTLQEWWMSYLQSKNSQTVATAQWRALVSADFPEEYGSPEEIFAQRGGIVHRLDKETSGVMILAKNPGSLAELLRQFRVREVHKKYVCLVHGKFQVLADTLTLPLGRSMHNRTQFAVSAEGRAAETQYQVQAYYPRLNIEKITAEVAEAPIRNWRKKLLSSYQGFSLVECWPKTGRTHQIRVHMSHIRHPIVADETYLGGKREQLDMLWCPRLFLHAAEVEFIHPRTKKTVRFSSPLPSDLAHALDKLETE
jgi:23S rRNA pseudouridine1911/1915/1917 synthase